MFKYAFFPLSNWRMDCLGCKIEQRSNLRNWCSFVIDVDLGSFISSVGLIITIVTCEADEQERLFFYLWIWKFNWRASLGVVSHLKLSGPGCCRMLCVSEGVADSITSHTQGCHHHHHHHLFIMYDISHSAFVIYDIILWDFPVFGSYNLLLII